MSSVTEKVDAIYTRPTLHSLPHRWRVKQVIRVLRELNITGSSYADVGCCDGFVTAQVAEALGIHEVVGYDGDPSVLEAGEQRFPTIQFRLWDLVTGVPQPESYSLVTCMETLEHVVDVQAALRNLLAITGGILLITVPIEVGFFGVAKFTLKTFLRKPTFEEGHRGSKFDYFFRLVRGAPISQFRAKATGQHWKLHTGFDYRELEAALRTQNIRFQASTRGWNRFYIIHKH